MPAKNAMSSLPFGDTVGEGFELMKKMWSMAGFPGIPSPGNLAQMATRLPQTLPNMIAPTLDVDELDKRIADLRAVEQWLQLNAGMLRTTIQSLEVQRATIVTLKQVGGAMLSPVIGKPEAATPSFATAPAPGTAATASAPPRRSAKNSRRGPSRHAPKAAEAALNPVAWWNTLQDQFTKIAAAATSDGGAAATKSPPARKRRASPKKA